MSLHRDTYAEINLKYLKEKDMTIVLASSSDMHWINTVLDGCLWSWISRSGHIY